MKDIYSKLIDIMRDMPAIGKDKVNAQQRFNYRGIDDVMNVLQPLFVKHGVFAVPEVLDKSREERTSKNGSVMAYTVLTVKYTLIAASDGSSVSAIVVGEGMDSGDKSTNKALSVAMKYAMFQLLCIPTEEMKDPDSESPELGAYICGCCHQPIGETLINGKKWPASSIAAASHKKYGMAMCYSCKLKADRNDAPGGPMDYDPRAEQEVVV